MSNSINGSRPDLRATPESGLASVVGYPSVIQRLTSIVAHPVTAAWAGTPGVVAPTGVLLYGPPGDAAGALAAAMASELGAVQTVVDARVSRLPTVDGSGVIHLHHFDDLLSGPAGSGSLTTRLFDHVARIEAHRRPLVIATSAAPWHLDPGLFIAGRFDRLAFVPPPGWEARSVALETGGAGRGLDVSPRISLLAAATVGWSGADLEELLDQLLAEPTIGPASEIGQPSFLLDVVSRIRPRTRSWIGRAREMVGVGSMDGMIDDLIAWLQRAD
jgi:hypothetical protein